MWTVCNMLWSIGEIVNVYEQLAWTGEHGFGGVGFHACAGAPGYWEGIDPAGCDARQRQRVAALLRPFDLVEIHAPFEIELAADDPSPGVALLMPVLEFAGDVGADVVTVHAALPTGPPPGGDSAWRDAMADIDALCRARGLLLGLEVLADFELVAGWGLPTVGVTLDLGHMFSACGGRMEAVAGMDGVIRRIGAALVHVHAHDHNGTVDHIETGTGLIDFPAVMRGLADIGYAGGLCLELNPTRVTPEGILRSRDYLERLMPDGDPNP